MFIRLSQRLTPILFGFALANCVPATDAPVIASPVPVNKASGAPEAAPPAVQVTLPPDSPAQAASREISGITFKGITFDSRSYRLRVVDQADGPGSEFEDAASAARSHRGIAGINGGFFTPEGEPLGWVLSAGQSSGTWNSASSLGSGIWHADSSGRQTISRREQLGRNAAAGMRELIQAGPLLVENGRAVGGLESSKISARSAILWDGGTRWWIGCTSPCSLNALGRALADGQPAGWSVQQALNLDGGRSSDLWVSGSVSGGPISHRAPWNRPVRNFLVLIAR